ncbi:MAG: CopG family transcriptional regulator [Chloroflexota bacterium]
MKRLQIMIEEDLDRELDRLARRERCSKAALVRKFVRLQVQPLPPIEEDPITLWSGQLPGDREGGEPSSVDDVVYPR